MRWEELCVVVMLLLGSFLWGVANGFARHLGYSVFMTKALKQVLTDQFAQIDVLEMNGKYSLNVSGVGFDAEVAHEFNHLKLREYFLIFMRLLNYGSVIRKRNTRSPATAKS